MMSSKPLPLWRVLEEEHLALGYTLPDAYLKARDEVLRGEPDADAPGTPGDAVITRHLMKVLAECPRTALCLSGGGIRSATFSLGVLQRLAVLRSGSEFNQGGGTYVQGVTEGTVLGETDFLSTVSGGGYIGGWFTAWRRRAGGLGAIASELAMPHAPTAKAPFPTVPEAGQVTHLRRYSRYLSPRAGMLAADTWTVVSTYLRNLLINWSTLIPFLLAALMAPRAVASVMALDMSDQTASRSWLLVALIVLAVAFAGLAFGYAGRHQPSGDALGMGVNAPTEGQARMSFILWCLVPLGLSSILLSLVMGWGGGAESGRAAMAVCFGSGLGVALFGWACALGRSVGREYLPKLGASVAGGLATGGSLFGVLKLASYAREHLGEVFPSVATTVGVPLILTAFSMGGLVYVALVSRLRTTSDEDREWWSRFGAYVLMTTAVWLVLAVSNLLLPAAFVISSTTWKALITAASVVIGPLVAVWGYGAKAAAKPGESETASEGRVRRIALPLLAPLFILALLTGLSFLQSYVLGVCVADAARTTHSTDRAGGLPSEVHDYFSLVHQSKWYVIVLWMLGLAALGMVVSLLVNHNKFSMHGMYRDRLIRAYLGASNPRREPDRFTGFDPKDNMYLHELHCDAVLDRDVEDTSDFVASLRDAATPDGPRWVQDAQALGPGAASLSSALVCAMERRREGRRVLAQLRRVPHGGLPGVQKDDIIAALNRVIFTADLVENINLSLFEIDGDASQARRLLPYMPARNRFLLESAYPGLRPRMTGRDGEAGEGIGSRPCRRPLHVINTALNLVGSSNIGWQDRKAQSFTMSPLHCGSWNLGYRPAVLYGGQRGASLGTAVTISGAAANPNMGHHTNAAVSFILTFFNVRLGMWLGNPGDAGRETFRLNGPRLGIESLVTEALGMTNESRRFVHLSDGGHFENLGLYEMVRRRCRNVIVVDAGCDPKCGYEDLGNALRKIRADMGVEITFGGKIPITPRDAKERTPVYWAVGKIHYSNVDPEMADGSPAPDGQLLYIKPSFYGNEPIDVYNYALDNDTFPHESTADQFFSESQFESYRALGQHVVDEIAKFREAKGPGPLIGQLM